MPRDISEERDFELDPVYVSKSCRCGNLSCKHWLLNVYVLYFWSVQRIVWQ